MILKEYIKTNKINVTKFAKSIGLKSRASIYRYYKGRKPEDEVMVKIAKVTNNQVTPNDFYGITPTPPKKGSG